jgi:myo-inositol catabolism protein IolS
MQDDQFQFKVNSPAWSKVGFGGAAISGEGAGYGFGNIGPEQARDLLLYAFESGVTLFDCAPIYGFSECEKRMGITFKNIREKVFITSKSGVSWHENKRVNMDNDPKIAQKMLETSLKDLNSDYIDLYMVHWPDKKWDIRNTLEVYIKAQDQGKIKHIGLCNTTVEDYQLAVSVCEITALQSEFNLFQNNSFDELSSCIEKDNLACMSWGTFDKGVLTGHAYKGRVYDKSDLRSWAPYFKKSPLDEKWEKVKKLSALLENTEFNLSDLALHFNLSSGKIKSALVGMRSFEQVDQTLNSLKKQIDLNLLEEAKSLFL